MRSWRGEDLEEALAAAGAVGYAVRSRNQWLEHPQGRTVASLPLLQSESTTGPSRTTAAGRGAVGLRVLDLTRVIAGPVATRTLAAWGAEVLRIDSPNLPEIPAQAVDTLPGKHSAELDLTEPIGRSRLEELLDAADLVVQGYRPGALARYGLDPNDLAERHPHLNIVTLSAWGPSGPWAGRAASTPSSNVPLGSPLPRGSMDAPGSYPRRSSTTPPDIWQLPLGCSRSQVCNTAKRPDLYGFRWHRPQTGFSTGATRHEIPRTSPTRTTSK